jgi:MFS transporter, OFA family, oxalate/formate antiporter
MNALLLNRWFQLTVGVVAMVATANVQYGWTLFVDPIATKFKWDKAAIQVAFSLFVISQTWLAPLLAYLRDKLGPQGVIAVGGFMVGMAWVINSFADSLIMLYAGGIVAGIGGGIVYTTAIGNALKLFPDRRGLAAGITSCAFGGGAALSVLPISNMIKASGYQRTFLVFGIAQGIIIVICSLLMRRPSVIIERLGLKAAQAGTAPIAATMAETTPVKMLASPVFWVLYVMFTMVATGGLMATAQLGPIAKSYGIADTPISVLGLFTLAALPLTLSLSQILNGLTRPFFGWLSDLIGLELTMFIAFTAEGIAIFSLIYFADTPIYFVLFSALAFFAWGEIYSIFPAISGDLFGSKFATTNYAFLYTAKGTASLLIPLGSYLQMTYGSWKPIFYVASAFDICAALLALLALKPMCRAYKARMAVVPQQPPESTLAQGVLPRVAE